MKKISKKATSPRHSSCACKGDGKCGPGKERCTCGGKGPGHKKPRRKKS